MGGERSPRRDAVVDVMLVSVKWRNGGLEINIPAMQPISICVWMSGSLGAAYPSLIEVLGLIVPKVVYCYHASIS